MQNKKYIKIIQTDMTGTLKHTILLIKFNKQRLGWVISDKERSERMKKYWADNKMINKKNPILRTLIMNKEVQCRQ